MKLIFSVTILIILFSLTFTGCGSEPVTKNVNPEKYNPNLSQRVSEFRIDFAYRKLKFNIPFGTHIDSIETDTIKKFINIGFNENFSHQPFRKENVNAIYSEVKSVFGEKFSGYKYTVITLNKPIEELIPNYYRDNFSKYDTSRLPSSTNRHLPVVQNISKPYKPLNGLWGRNIVVWPSHGWYYNNKEERWEWQRPRLFQSVEDVLPLSFVVPYLMPMLENAGANVFDPRERDVQSNSVVVDNDSPSDLKLKYYVEKSTNKKNRWKDAGAGFAEGAMPYPSGYNPFLKGSSRSIESETVPSASVNWTDTTTVSTALSGTSTTSRTTVAIRL